MKTIPECPNCHIETAPHIVGTGRWCMTCNWESTWADVNGYYVVAGPFQTWEDADDDTARYVGRFSSVVIEHRNGVEVSNRWKVELGNVDDNPSGSRWDEGR